MPKTKRPSRKTKSSRSGLSSQRGSIRLPFVKSKSRKRTKGGRYASSSPLKRLLSRIPHAKLVLPLVLFALVGSYFVFFSKAAETAVATYEAENFVLPAGAGVYDDSSASGGKAIVLANNGTATYQTSMPTATRFVVTARGDSCKGAAQMSVSIDGVQAFNTSLGGSWNSYSADKSIPAGSHTITITFSNDRSRGSCSRAVRVDKVTLFNYTAEVSTGNLAAGKPVTSSAPWATGLPLTTDGDLNTANYTNMEAGPQWVQIDLGQVYTINSLNLRHYYEDGRTYHDVIAELSSTGDFSTNKTTIFNNDRDNSSGQGAGANDEYAETSAGKTINLPASINARYIRLWTNGSNANPWNHYVEVQAFGAGASTAEPSPAPAPSPTPTPTTSPSYSKIESWRPVGSAPLSDAEAAARVRPVPEHRPENAVPNSYKPSAAELQAFLNSETDSYNRTPGQANPLYHRVTGGFAGTTDEIFQWAAHKWGIPEDWIRAQAITESDWRQSGMGDRKTVADPSRYPAQSRIAGTNDVYQSLGIMQVKWNYPDDRNTGIGTEPLRWKSTAFNVDFYAASVRFYFDDPEGLRTAWADSVYYPNNPYYKGDEWLSIGGWFQPWPWNNEWQNKYISNVKCNLYEDRRWENNFVVRVPCWER